MDPDQKQEAKLCFNVVLFGLGRAGQIHFHNLRANSRTVVKYIVEENMTAAQKIVSQFRVDAKVVPVSEMKWVLEDTEVDAVIVCTPTFTHEEIVCKALIAGKAVYCEKPIAEDVERTKNCYDIAAQTGKILFCSFNRRFDPSLRRIYDRIINGDIGAATVAKTTSRDYPPPSIEYLKVSGGIFHDCAVHDLDMVTWFLGELPSRVSVTSHCHHPEIRAMGDQDTVVISLKFPSGAIAVVDISRHSAFGYDQRVEILGERGMLLSENQKIDNSQILNENGTTASFLKPSCVERYKDSYQISLDNFLDILQGKANLDITKEVCVNVSLLAEACEQSCKTGMSVEFIPYV